MQNTPIITVTCVRDLPMLDLQAQSLNLYLDKNCPIYIIVNEDNCELWQEHFDKNIKDYYKNHNLTVIYKKDFQSNWSQWIPSLANPWAVGWETQQILKLAVSEIVNHPRYLVLDSQNFLIKKWSPENYKNIDGKIPARPGHFVMPLEIWDQYSEKLEVKIPPPTTDTMSMCTPIFFKTDLVKSLIEQNGGVISFTDWFKQASNIKSEFILYLIWAEKQGGFKHHHHMLGIPQDWANPYLRDCRSNKEFNDFISFVGVHDTHAWVSINHRAWGNMNIVHYNHTCEKLKEYNLIPRFNEYRSSYVDLKI